MTFDTKPKANNDIETQTNSVVSEVRFYFPKKSSISVSIS